MCYEPKSINLPEKIYGSLAELPEKHGPLILTHSGVFHADDVLAVGLLLQLPQYKNACVIRTRDKSSFDKADVVVDVGLIYDPFRRRFDHHQDMEPVHYGLKFTTPLSSVGMVFKHLDREIIKALFNVTEAMDLDYICSEIYASIIESVDASDNGISESSTEIRFKNLTNLSSRISRLNIPWNSEKFDVVASREFIKAMDVGVKDFIEIASYVINIVAPYVSIVQESLKTLDTYHPSGRVLYIDTFCSMLPDILRSLSYKVKGAPEFDKLPATVIFFIYRSADNIWSLRSTNIPLHSFKAYCYIPNYLRMLTEEEYTKLGYQGVHFVHNSGFIAKAYNVEVLKKLATDSMLSNCQD